MFYGKNDMSYIISLLILAVASDFILVSHQARITLPLKVGQSAFYKVGRSDQHSSVGGNARDGYYVELLIGTPPQKVCNSLFSLITNTNSQ